MKQPPTESTTQFNNHVFSVGEDQCSARPFLCMLPPPLSTAILEAACTPSKEVKESQCFCPLQAQTEVSSFHKFAELLFFFLRESFRQKMDQTNVRRGISDPSDGLRDSLLHKLHRYLLPRLQSHPVRHHGRLDELVRLVCFICYQTKHACQCSEK